MNSPNCIIDSFASVGNKVIAVTGRLELFGTPVATKYTRLIANAKPGDTTIQVATAIGWVIGDEIAIGPSNKISSEGEKFKITLINGNTITLNEAIKYFHYGDPKQTATTDSTGIN